MEWKMELEVLKKPSFKPYMACVLKEA